MKLSNMMELPYVDGVNHRLMALLLNTIHLLTEDSRHDSGCTAHLF